jgi:REP element-mobilizing transposase RayT
MVRYYHAIFTAYGFWLPNDPRGSWSDFVGAWELYKFGGPATLTKERRSLARDSHDAAFRRGMKTHLKRPPVRFDDAMRAAVVRGFAWACGEAGVIVRAGCVGWDHVHVVVERHRVKSIEQVVGLLKGRATQQLRGEGLWNGVNEKGVPLTPWAYGCWKVFINDEAHLRAAVEYVGRHPSKEGLIEAPWTFVHPLGT